MLRGRSRRSLTLYTAILLLVVSATRAEESRLPVGAHAAPFDSATVTLSGSQYMLSWHASGTSTVMVYAGTDPLHVGRGRLVATGGRSGASFVSNLPPSALCYFEFVPDARQSLVLADRSLHLHSASNFRDVGGYRTQDGRWVRMGIAFRSNGIGVLNQADYWRVRKLNLRLICDLRTEHERRHMPDPELPGSNFLAADVAADGKFAHDLSALIELTNHGDQAAVAEYVKDAYREFVTLPSARGGYHQLFERPADPRSLPMLFHCTAGKDRTGWAQAILLTILGVPRAITLRDYALTDRYMSSAALERIRQVMPGVSPKIMRTLVLASPDFLEAAFKEAVDRYGSFDNYLREGLGLDATILESIRSNFLTS